MIVRHIFEISDDHASTTNQNGGQNEEYITSDSAMLSYTPGVNSRAELLPSTRVYARTALRAVVRGQNWQTSHVFFHILQHFAPTYCPFITFPRLFNAVVMNCANTNSAYYTSSLIQFFSSELSSRKKK